MDRVLCSVLFTTFFLSVTTPQYVPNDVNDPREASHNRNILRSDVYDALDKQVSLEMKASLLYMTMASYFNSEKHDRPGFAKFFRKSSDEEREHAQKFIDYLNKRGNTMKSWSIEMPTKFSWDTGLIALEHALSLENEVTDALMKIHSLATNVGDGHLTDYLESEFLDEQIESIRTLKRYINHLTYMMPHKHDKNHHSSMLAEYLFDLQLQGKDVNNIIVGVD